jgi:hypothetical protein
MQQRRNRLGHGLIHIEPHGHKKVVELIFRCLRPYCPNRHENTFAVSVTLLDEIYLPPVNGE